MARTHGSAETLDFSEVKIYDALMEMTGGRGPDRCIDCVGTESDASASLDAMLDRPKPPCSSAPTGRMCCAK
jgi:threonine dehydrogenase-like Zn-dependent dehydrogenase